MRSKLRFQSKQDKRREDQNNRSEASGAAGSGRRLPAE